MNYSEKEAYCRLEFDRAGQFWHLWTMENFEIIFTSEDDFRAGMTIFGICAKICPQLKIITFELMTNHLHIMACGPECDLEQMFEHLKKMLKAYFNFAGRDIDWNGFVQKHRALTDIDDARTIIVYDNRNGFIVNDLYTPYTYPWGANRYYFNPDSRQLATLNSKRIGLREKRHYSHSRIADNITDLDMFEGCALPLSFCDINLGEALFRSPAQYFTRVSRCAESDVKIAREIGESIFYTDDDLFSAILRICKKGYGCQTVSELTVDAKIEIAKRVRYDFNASAKQIRRMLKLDPEVLLSLGIK